VPQKTGSAQLPFTLPLSATATSVAAVGIVRRAYRASGPPCARAARINPAAHTAKDGESRTRNGAAGSAMSRAAGESRSLRSESASAIRTGSKSVAAMAAIAGAVSAAQKSDAMPVCFQGCARPEPARNSARSHPGQRRNPVYLLDAAPAASTAPA
jgi:hypothetical protein